MIFLRQIEVRGFKSFAKLTKINFYDGLSVIVGPNGSGKSNIYDAIKWVLGETSKKNLRAITKKDMIFSGNDDIPMMDKAEVSLIFNNEKRILDLDFNEVRVTRVSYRNEDNNEYYINKTRVRRKDIKNLFLDTGLGNLDLSIISQGSVQKITEAKPENLKSLLNEAAGVGKYEVRKIESKRKLERINNDFDVFNVKLKELKGKLRLFVKQKEDAESYYKIWDKLKLIELYYIKEKLIFEIPEKSKVISIIENMETQKIESSESLMDLNDQESKFQQKLIEIEKVIYDLNQRQIEATNLKNSNLDKKGENLSNEIDETILSIEDIKKIVIETSQREQIQIKLRNDYIIEKQRGDSNLADVTKKLNQLEYYRSNFQNTNSNLNRGTKVILDNKNIFKSVHNIIKNLIDYNEDLELAISVSLGNKLNNILVEDEKTIKEVIRFLKDNKYGQATFMPFLKVEPRYISDDYLSVLRDLQGYNGTLNDHINSKPIYRNAIDSISSNILLFDTLDNALVANKMLNYKFKIVTYEGDLILPGFVIRGGSHTRSNQLSKSKEIDLKITEFTEDKKKLLFEIVDLNKKIEDVDIAISSISHEQTRLSERISNLKISLDKLLILYEKQNGKKYNVNLIINTHNTSSNSDYISIEDVKNQLKKYHDEKILYSNNLFTIREKRNKTNDKWKESLESLSLNKNNYARLSKSIDYNFEILNRDYKMTLENLEHLTLKKPKESFEEIEQLRNNYRKDLKKIGYVNIEAIKIYSETEKDYTKLKDNCDDLIKTRKKLLDTIEILDEKMKETFITTFDNVNTQFSKTFKELYKVGKVKLYFSEPNDILNSGIELSIDLPGKKLSHLSLFSGGEKSMIALSLIFSINIVRNLPLLMLDEAESALDEANVEKFASFAKTIDSETQIIAVSHRLGTMEKADLLYGVTMQEKGITSIVSIKLEDATDFID